MFGGYTWESTFHKEKLPPSLCKIVGWVSSKPHYIYITSIISSCFGCCCHFWAKNQFIFPDSVPNIIDSVFIPYLLLLVHYSGEAMLKQKRGEFYSPAGCFCSAGFTWTAEGTAWTHGKPGTSWCDFPVDCGVANCAGLISPWDANPPFMLLATAAATAFAGSVVPLLARVTGEHNDNIEVDEVADEPRGRVCCCLWT